MIPAWSCALLIASCNTAQPVMPEPEPADLDDSRFPPDPDSPVMAPELKREAEYCVGFRGPADRRMISRGMRSHGTDRINMCREYPRPPR